MRPVVALDVDGVVNFTTGPVKATLNVPAADQPKSPFLRGRGTRDVTLQIAFDPAVSAWISALEEHADVMWATTWERVANDYLAPLLGIPALPLAVSVEADPPGYRHAKHADSCGWKATALRQRFNGRPLVWLDDLAHGYTAPHPEDRVLGRAWYDWRDPATYPHVRPPSAYDLDEDFELDDGTPFVTAPTLVLAPDEQFGLTEQDRAAVLAFVTDPYGYSPPFADPYA